MPVELLQRMPIFGAIREDVLAYLLEEAGRIAVQAGDFFFREHDEASAMYVLERGSVAVIKGWHGRELLLRRLGPGDCFGEMALMDLFPRSASVRALADCSAIELTAANLYRLFERDTEQFALIQMNIGREVCRRLRETDSVLFRASMEDVPIESDTTYRTL